MGPADAAGPHSDPAQHHSQQKHQAPGPLL